MAVSYENTQSRAEKNIEVVRPLNDYNPFPSWCVLEPKITDEHTKILIESWHKLISGNSQGFRQHKSSDGSAIKKASFGKYTPTRSSIVHPAAPSLMYGIGLVPEFEKDKPSEESDRKARSETAILSAKRALYLSAPSETDQDTGDAPITPALSIGIDAPAGVVVSQKIASAKTAFATDKVQDTQRGNVHPPEIPGLRTPMGSEQIQNQRRKSKEVSPDDRTGVPQTPPTPRSNAEAFNFFYDIFFERLFHVNLALNLRLGGDIKSRVEFIKGLCSFLVNTAKIPTAEVFIDSVNELIKQHSKNHITAVDYDAIGQALLLALKHCLGNDYNTQVQESWRLFYSRFLTIGLQYVDGPKTVYIKKRNVPHLNTVFQIPLADIEESPDSRRPIPRVTFKDTDSVLSQSHSLGHSPASSARVSHTAGSSPGQQQTAEVSPALRSLGALGSKPENMHSPSPAFGPASILFHPQHQSQRDQSHSSHSAGSKGQSAQESNEQPENLNGASETQGAGAQGAQNAPIVTQKKKRCWFSCSS